ncbi:flagellar basal-body rod protein FlgG [Schlesneria paludicola]|uniref:flagellar basal-body rod protein FlgG n=1 Tax=Schlesneria paludicola TaxID=360056 RepID=UPI00029B37DA|nr:flagellar basal-body rod protein FlgG [Schlesneria paludicola]
MMKSLYTSATGMQAHQTVVDTTANNLANVDTTGFKRSQVEFQDLLYQTVRAAGTQGAIGYEVPTGIQIGSGVRIAGTSKVFTPGVLENTNNDFDLSIQGQGFFQILMPNGEFRYTRDGSFRTNSTGNLVTADGYSINPPITIPADTLSMTVGSDGTVSVITAGAPTTATTVGNIALTRFPNPSGLSSEGRNLFAETSASGPQLQGIPGSNGLGSLTQGFLERSNVQVVTELIRLITAQRAFEASQRCVLTSDQMLQTTNNMIR